MDRRQEANGRKELENGECTHEENYMKEGLEREGEDLNI